MTNKISVVVIDDDEFQIAQLSTVFDEEHFEANYIIDTNDVVADICRLDPDVIVLDLFMPERNGLQICLELKEDPCTVNIPIILMSSSSEREHKKKALIVGCIDYLTKPVLPNDLKAKINHYAKFGSISKLANAIRSK